MLRQLFQKEAVNPTAVDPHQRPAGDEPEWRRKDPATLKFWHRWAEKTNGWGTLANAVSFIGAIATAKGMYDISKGRTVKGTLEITAGRLLDLVDGKIATAMETRSKVSAGVDAGLDKALAAAALTMLTKKKAIPRSMAMMILGQQAAIAGYNVLIENAGGEPNPSRDGKDLMFDTSEALTIAAFGLGLQHNGHKFGAMAVRGALMFMEPSLGELGSRTIGGYAEQSRELGAKWSDIGRMVLNPIKAHFQHPVPEAQTA